MYVLQGNENQDEWIEVKSPKRPRVQTFDDDTNSIELVVIAEDILNAMAAYARNPEWYVDPIAVAIRRQLKCSFVTVGWGYATTYLDKTKTQWTIEPFAQCRDYLKEWQEHHFGLLPTTFTMWRGNSSTSKPQSQRPPRRRPTYFDEQQKRAKL